MREDQSPPGPAGAAFREGYVDADGFRIRYLEAGEGPPLVHLHGAGGPRLTRAHDLLARHFRVVAFEMPGFGQSPENRHTASMPELASTMARAVRKLGLDTFNLMGTSFGGTAALWLALQEPEHVLALVLEAPAAIRPEGAAPPSGSPEELVQRLRGPARDADLEGRLQELVTPTLVLFGTLDSVIPPGMGRFYKELVPNCHLVFVYDAAHAIGADRPEAFAEVVGDFLERREAFVISRAATVIHP
jgi:pimeloyl-ACP methyl ester carboxylesterase